MTWENREPEPGKGDPIPLAENAAIKNGWRRNTPPIVESLDETYEEVIEKQGRDDNRGQV